MEFAALQKEMITAMKAREKSKKDAISSIVAAVKKVAIDEGHREDIPEELVDRVILKELKTAKEQLDSCPADRTELKAEYQERYDYIAAYAPKMMSEDEVRAYLNEKFAAGCSRDVINTGAERLGWELDELLQRTIEAMRSCEASVASAMQEEQ